MAVCLFNVLPQLMDIAAAIIYISIQLEVGPTTSQLYITSRLAP